MMILLKKILMYGCRNKMSVDVPIQEVKMAIYEKSKLTYWAFLALMLLCLCVPCMAVDRWAIGTSPADRMLAEYFRAETAKLRDPPEADLADVKTLKDWETKREVYRKQLFEMLSLDPLPEKTDLMPVITGKVEHDEFTVEKIHYQSRPGLYVTGNLYVPKGLEKPAPTILY